MVSNARLDLPEPERPVTTTRLSRGISTETFFRLCTRAPWTPIVVRTLAFVPSALRRAGPPLRAIGFLRQKERQFWERRRASLCRAYGSRCLRNQFLIGQVFARR